MTPAFAVAVPASADEQDLPGALASLHASAARAGTSYEIVVAVNGPGEPSAAAAGVRRFAAGAGLPLIEDPTGQPAGAVATGTGAAGAGMPADAAGAGTRVGRTASGTPAGVAATRMPVAGDAAEGPSGGAPGPVDGDACGGAAASPCVRLVRLAPRSKVAAWNAIRAATRAPVIVFADADVRVAPEAVPLLVRRLTAEPALAAATGREVATLAPGDGLAARVAALPFRFDFGNVPGRLYALRAAALAEAMPPSVLAEDAYLTVRLGRHAFAREPGAVVYLRPPGTWRDYVRQRVRNEVGKLQVEREFAALHRAHGFGRRPGWRTIVRAIAPREYPLVALSLAARVWARGRALGAIRHGFPTGWSVLPSTKAWAPVAAAGAASGGGDRPSGAGH